MSRAFSHQKVESGASKRVGDGKWVCFTYWSSLLVNADVVCCGVPQTWCVCVRVQTQALIGNACEI